MNPLTWHGWPRADKARKVHLQVYSPPSTIAAEVQGSRASTVPPMTLRFASCLPACQIRSIRCNNLKREGAHGWIASRKLIEKGNRTPAYHGNVFPSYEEDEPTEGRAASPNPSGTIRQRWIRWPRIQSSWIRESTPADANTQD